MYSKEATKFVRKRSHFGDGWWLCTRVVCGDEFESNQSSLNTVHNGAPMTSPYKSVRKQPTPNASPPLAVRVRQAT